MINEIMSEFTDEYILKKIIYVNSAEFGYAEIELDEHIALYGSNNAGKTGTLAGTKIVLFPETSFVNCKKKFMFSSKDGKYYDTEDSYAHYFPDSRSFIAMEVENPHGVFSMVCYRTNNYGYARFFIPTPYSEIRSIFTIGESGELNPELSIQLITEKNKELGGLRVSDKKELADLMFGSRLDVPEKSRFCVLPLRDSKKETIDALRNVYQLAFDSGSSATETLPSVLATLVEMKRGRDKEKLDANLSALVEARNRLAEDSDWIQALENSQSDFDYVWDKLSEAKTVLSNYSTNYYSLERAIIKAKKTLASRRSSLNASHLLLKSEVELSEKDLKDKSSELLNQNATLKVKNKDLKEAAKKLAEAKKIRSEYSIVDDNQLLSELYERLESAKNELSEYREESGIVNRLQEKINEKNKLEKKKKGIEESISQKNSLLFYHLDQEHVKNVLYTLNPKLSHAQFNLRPEQVETVQAFTSLFGFDATGTMTLNDKVIHQDLKVLEFNLDRELENWQLQLQEVENELLTKREEIEKLKKYVKNDNPAELIEDFEKEVSTLEKKYTAIRNIPAYSQEHEALTIETKELKDNVENLIDERDALDSVFKKNESKFGILNSQLKDLHDEEKTINSIDSSMSLAKGNYLPEFSDSYIDIDELSSELGAEVIRLSSTFIKHFNSLKEVYHSLEMKVSHPDIDRHQGISSLSEYDRNIRIYQSTFETLDHEKQKLSNAILSHNSTLNSQLNELKEAKETIAREISSIDSDLNSKSVSNLSEIELKVSFDPVFLNIMSTLDKHEIEGNSLLEENFYNILSQLFSKKYYDKSTGRLRLRDIIQSVNYRFTKRDTGKAEGKGQSGGTTTTVTAFVLSVLLSRVAAPHTKLKMPIIVDEIGTLDNKNKKATIEQVSRHGFALFCATPSFLAAVNRYVGRYIYIDREKLEKPMVESCHNKIIPKFIGQFGEKADAS